MTADLLRGLQAPAIVRTVDNDFVILDLAPLEQELAACGKLARHEIVRCVIYWLETRCKLGKEFVMRIVEVSTPNENIHWRTPEWLIRALRVYTGTCVQHST